MGQASEANSNGEEGLIRIIDSLYHAAAAAADDDDDDDDAFTNFIDNFLQRTILTIFSNPCHSKRESISDSSRWIAQSIIESDSGFLVVNLDYNDERSFSS